MANITPREYLHRYKVLAGVHSGLVSNGVQIGLQEYPNQIFIEKWTVEQIQARRDHLYSLGLGEGIWLADVKQPIYRQVNAYNKVDITEEGANYGGQYLDLCVPFDRYGNEIFVGSNLVVASKNEVRKVIVTKIAKKPYMASYGIIDRKLTVYDEQEDQTLTINSPSSTVLI